MKKIQLLLTLCFLLSTNLFTAQGNTCFVCHKSNFEEPNKTKNNETLPKLKSKVIPNGCAQNHCFHLDCLTESIIAQKEMKCPAGDCTYKVTLPMRKYPRKKTKNAQATLECFTDYGIVLQWTDPETQESFQIGHTKDNPSHVCPLRHSAVNSDCDTVPLFTLPYARRMILAAQRNARDTLTVGSKPYTDRLVEGEKHVVAVFNSLAENAHPKNRQLLEALNLFTAHLKKESDKNKENRTPQEVSDEKIEKMQLLSSMGRYGTDDQERPICPKGRVSTIIENNKTVYSIYH